VISTLAGEAGCSVTCPDPARNLPRAIYIALGIITVLYVLISVGVFGTLTVVEVIANGATALAQAAKPALGEAGFVMMAIAALPANSQCRELFAFAVRMR
jgi:amino acid transporter